MLPEEKIINKTMEPSDLDSDAARSIIAELNALVGELKRKELKISSWYGKLGGEKDPFEQINRGYHYTPLEGAADDENFPWFLYWEIVWVTLQSEFRTGQTVLDLGGSSSLFSYYLATKGLAVTTIDSQRQLVENANRVAQRMSWNLENYEMDMRTLDFSRQFDHVTSVCVYEHIPMYDRVKINKTIESLLVLGGKFSITFDYRNPSRLASIDTPEDVYDQFVKPSRLEIRGNQDFLHTGRSYLLHPFYYPGNMAFRASQIRRGHFAPAEIFKTKTSNDYTFGALFQNKPNAR
jgi:2-polyprenyl-3-methyl-5-hydroxy-6-metoxy-1,4-benzoquinol methylase